MLRGKRPDPVKKRLKLFLYGTAGVGKTTAALEWPNPYIIDAEKGTENYDAIINANGGAVYQSTDAVAIIDEVRQLLTTKHDYKTLIIDPITMIYNDLLEKCELKVGSDFGRHYGEANKYMKRLANLVMSLDMNVIVTAHAKAEYGTNLTKLGYTFDGWKQLDYWFDLVLELSRPGGKRTKNAVRKALVVKSRINTFPDADVFDWTMDEFRKRYEPTLIDSAANVATLATAEQLNEINELFGSVKVPASQVTQWFTEARVDTWEDMRAEFVEGILKYVRELAATKVVWKPAAAAPLPAAAPPPARPVPANPPPPVAPVSAAGATGAASTRVAPTAGASPTGNSKPELIRKILVLLEAVHTEPDAINKWFAKAAQISGNPVDKWDDMPLDPLVKINDYLMGKLKDQGAERMQSIFDKMGSTASAAGQSPDEQPAGAEVPM